jgi:hypothetical protein
VGETSVAVAVAVGALLVGIVVGSGFLQPVGKVEKIVIAMIR